ncbi:MAG: FtsQ-type POTRA domain-containing protein [Deltaproteobacteria bacterium]|nr:FtsQ-type POTRA domain-containing protein [Deltaproteobacteria bacterium]
MSTRALVRPEWRGEKRGRARNRKVSIQRRSLVLILADFFTGIARVVALVVRKLSLIVAVGATLFAVVVGGRSLVRTVVASEHFSVRSISINATAQVTRQEIETMGGVAVGDRLLSVDPDAVAARIAAHPWVSEVQVRRHLPAILDVQVIERKAAAVVNLDGLYLVDERGHPFKRATTTEAIGLVVLSGLERERFASVPQVVEAVYREALSILRTYYAIPSRPELSEVVIDAASGYSLILLDGGGQIRLGREHYGEKLARFDKILEALQKNLTEMNRSALSALALVHLEGTTTGRVSVRLRSQNPQ